RGGEEIAIVHVRIGLLRARRFRLTDLMTSGQLFADIGQSGLDPRHDRFMLCGSPQLLADLKTIFTEQGLREGNHGEPGDYVIEKAFVEK
ncbi:MAG: hypothetical protein AB7F96_22110, partial [Beijerinckiaceae bacterium]